MATKRAGGAIATIVAVACLVLAGPATAAYEQRGTIVPIGGASGTGFGTAIALSADGATLVVGAPTSSRAYVFDRTGDAWTQRATLQPPTPESGDGFGSAVALSADGTTAVVGAPTRSANAGAAYVYRRGGGWADSSAGTAIAGAAGSFSGGAVAVSGDGGTIAVGRPGGACGLATIAGGATPGAVALYSGPLAPVPVPSATLTAAATPEAGDLFGCALAIDDAGATIVVGAPEHGGAVLPAHAAGEAYAFRRPGGGWATTAVPDAATPPGAAGAVLGSAAAISRDGLRATIGGPRATTVAGAVGGTSTFALAPVSATLLTTTAGPAGALHGRAVALSADGTQLVVGADGATQLYRIGTGTATAIPLPSGLTGGAVAISGGGPGAQVLVGTPGVGVAVLTPAPTATTVGATAATATAPAAVAYTASVRTTTGDAPVAAGSVAFSDGGAPIAGCGAQPLDPSGRATCVVSYPAPGDHAVAAAYAGDDEHRSSATTAAAAVSIVAPGGGGGGGGGGIGGGGTGGGSGPPRKLVPRIAKVVAGAPAVGSFAYVVVTCADKPCRGTLRLRLRRRVPIGRRSLVVRVTVAHRSFGIGDGKSAVVRLRLDPETTRALARKRRLPVSYTASVKGGKTRTGRLTLVLKPRRGR